MAEGTIPPDDDYHTPAPEIYDDSALPSDSDDIDKAIRKLDYEEAKNAIRYRRWFLAWGLGAVSFCIVVSALTVGSLFWFGGYREMGSVLIAFIGSLAVEVVGIAVIIAKYLFPNGGPHTGHNAG